jgi:transmembrane sensor
MSSHASTAEQSRCHIPPERIAEAGVWVARLHSGGERRSAEEGVRRWLRESPINAQAFALATEVWDDAANLHRVLQVPAPVRVHWPRFLRPVGVALAALALVVVIVFTAYQRLGVVATGIGEQRLLTLEDGTRIFLNTGTRVAVHYDDEQRRIELASGEALFYVAKNQNRPFVVMVEDRQVRALGTSFVVRKDEGRLSVALMEGSVAINPSQSLRNSSPDSQAPAASSQRTTFTLTPGERLTFVPGAAPVKDMPALDNLTAWRRGQVVLDDTPLPIAVAEMNRYSKVKLAVSSSALAKVHVSGLFQAGDSSAFAAAVASTSGLRVVERDGAIVLTDR